MENPPKNIPKSLFALLCPALLILFVMLNTADLLTTIIGLGMGFSEGWSSSVLIFQISGEAGWITVKVLMSIAGAAVYLVWNRAWMMRHPVTMFAATVLVLPILLDLDYLAGSVVLSNLQLILGSIT